jgi:hypothetical protein
MILFNCQGFFTQGPEINTAQCRIAYDHPCTCVVTQAQPMFYSFMLKKRPIYSKK